VVWSFVYLALCRLLSWLCCCVNRSARRSLRSSCSDTSWRSCAGSRGERPFDPWIERCWPRSRGRCREVRGRVCKCVRRRCCVGTVSWSGGAGLTRRDARDGRRSIVGSRRWLFGSHARTRAGLSPDRRRAAEPRDRRFGDIGATILARHGLPPAPQRDKHSRRNFLRQHATTTLACDFFTVETASLKRIYVLFFILLESRPVEFVACTSNPTGAWVTQQARNLLMAIDDRERPFRFLIHDRDSKFSGAFDHVFQSEGIAVIRAPVQAPNANADAERWVLTIRNDCLDRLLIISRRQLEHVLRVYTRHSNRHRPHRALALRPPEQASRSVTPLGAPPYWQLRRTDYSAASFTNTNTRLTGKRSL
jgi:hypothetical protein